MDTLQILRSLRDSFVENGHEEAVLVTKDSGKTATDMLVTLHRDFGKRTAEAQGMFYFDQSGRLPLFVSRLLLGEDIPNDAILPLCTEISLVNPTLPLGSFAFDAVTGSLEYLARLPIPEDWDQETLLTEADCAVALSLSVAERFAQTLQEIIGSYGV